jgi:hypothetical protein
MRKVMILGTMIMGGRELFDSDMLHHVFHVPGVEFTTHGATIKLNPMLTASLEAKSSDDEFWLSSFMQKWLPSGPIPMIANRLARLSASDIPAIYKDNKLNYLLAVPRIKEKE